MKIGFNLLLWTGHLGDEHGNLLRDITPAGYDGVDSLFAGSPDH